MLDAMRAHEQVIERVEAIRAYAGTEAHKHVVGLLEALRTAYMHDLVDVTAEQLQLKQGALRQVMALLDAIAGPIAAVPRI